MLVKRRKSQNTQSSPESIHEYNMIHLDYCVTFFWNLIPFNQKVIPQLSLHSKARLNVETTK